VLPAPVLPVALAAAALGASSDAPAPPLAVPHCFGAAARDPRRPCLNPALRRTVVPSPARGRPPAPEPCPRIVRRPVTACAFGVPAVRATARIALVGDSHASHWRPAFAQLAAARRWHVRSVSHASCPLSTALRDLPEPARTSCRRFKRGVLGWLGGDPGVSTVVVSGLSGGRGVEPAAGRGRFATAVAGYLGAWRRVTPGVRRIVVLHDTPKTPAGTPACLRRALADGRDPGPSCATPRRDALDPDPIAAAARAADDPRVRAVDLTSVFCGPRRCRPVVGGALVHRDTHHLAAPFVRTVAPVLERELDRVLADAQPASSGVRQRRSG
jgi:hypothetical protein